MDNHSQCGKCGIVFATHRLMDDHQCKTHEEIVPQPQQVDAQPEPEAQLAQHVEEGNRLQEGQAHRQEDQEVPQPQPQVNADNIFDHENIKLKK